MGDCNVELNLYNAADELVDTINVPVPPGSADFIFQAGTTTVESINYCAESIDVEIETRGANTGIITGTVRDENENPIPNAIVYWNLGGIGNGGLATTNAQGFFSMVAIAGHGALITVAENKKANARVNVSLESGHTTTVSLHCQPL